MDRKQENKLIWLLIGSTIFAWANTGYTFYKYISKESGTDFFGCPADKIDNPFTTACFMGASAFLVSLIFGWLYLRSLKNSD